MSTTTASRPIELGGAKIFSLRRLFEFGGFVAGATLIAFGVVAIFMAVDGRSTVHDSLVAEKIVAGENMTVAAVRAEAEEAGIAGLPGIAWPTTDIAGKQVTTGAEARTFAQYLRIHALEASGGFTYAEMGRFATPDGSPKGTSDPAAALKDDAGNPVANSARNTWVTATALTTALNVSYMAEQLALFGLVVGIALLLSGIGFIVLAYAALHRRPAAA
jgi:hypothetical protein